MTDIVLGECWAAPAGYSQNYMFETIEDSLASNVGRGAGKPENDIYAVGVTNLALLFGKILGSDWDEETTLKQKILYGTYNALVPQDQVNLQMIEPLRGMLNDKPSDRWELDDLSLWIDGRRLSQLAKINDKSDTRVFLCWSTTFHRAGISSIASKNWNEAINPINDGTLDTWIRRSIGDSDLTEAIGFAKPNIDLNSVELNDEKRKFAKPTYWANDYCHAPLWSSAL